MVVDPYTNLSINTGEETRLDGIKKYRLPILYFMFLSFFAVLFTLIVLVGWVPEEIAYNNTVYGLVLDVLGILFYVFLVIMVLSPVAAMALYPEYRIMFLVMGVVLWVLTASAWFLLLSLP